MKIIPPFGYDEIVPLRKTHRVLLPHGATPAFCRTLNALAVSVSEFNTAARDYPIVFTSLDQGKSFAPVVVVGLRNRQNLFINVKGDWDGSVYLPAFVRRYPFCISKLYVDGQPRSEKVVCVAKEYLDKTGLALYDKKGNPTEQWQSIERLLTEYEADLDRTAYLCAALKDHGLFAPFVMQATAGNGENMQLRGMYRVDEAKLANLDAGQLKTLLANGALGKVFAHLHSLENFARLVNRATPMQRPVASEEVSPRKSPAKLKKNPTSKLT